MRPSAFETAFWETTTTSAVISSVRSASEIVPLGDLGEPLDRKDPSDLPS